LLRIEFGGDIMRLGAARMIAQHLFDHLLCLSHVPRFGSVIDLLHARIIVGKHGRRKGDSSAEHRQSK
jgi:hypothetical protein